MSTDNTTTCPNNSVPEPVNLGIESKSVFAVVPRGNYTTDAPDDWMVTCCEPNEAQLASDGVTGICWQWCDLPPTYTNQTSDPSQLTNEFLRCITSTSRASNSSNLPSAVLISGAASHGMLGDGTMGLSVVLVIAIWQLCM
ncbi:hypothetical protein diail_10900 [Diaporthe ilicicola]|nr:hypothetical protein diail_10900 [Diaporthe ilicicola]